MNFFILFTSIFLNSVGAFLDIYTTSIFIKDLGIEFEANRRVRDVISKHGYKTEILLQAVFIMMIGIVDSLELLYSFLFLGLIFLEARGLAAAHNFQIIVEYRTIGIDTYKEQVKSRRQILQKLSLWNRIKLILPYFAEALICLATYVILITIDFPLVSLIRSLIVGLLAFSIAKLIFH